MRMKLTIIVGTVVILSMSLVGCGSKEPSPSPFASPALTSPLPTAEPSPVAPVLVFPTSRPGLATVTGVILRADTKTSIQNELYLGEVLETTDPEQKWVGLDKAIAPRAILDSNTGAFAFYDVPPGTYALEISRPLLTPVLVTDPEAGGTMFLTIQADDNIDLGTILVVIP